MARIAFLAYDFEQNNVVSVKTNKKTFYLNIAKSLQQAGNDVLCIDCVWEANKVISQSLKTKLTSFDPDVCIMANYGFMDLAEIVDCPLWYMDIDSIENVSMATTYRMRNNKSRCYFIVSEYDHIEIIKRKFDVDDDRILLIDLPYSEISGSSEKSYNVLYFGTNYCTDGYAFLHDLAQHKASDKDVEEAKIVLNQYESDPSMTSKEIYNSHNFYAGSRIELKDRRTYNQIIGLKKLRFLSAISDINLSIKGDGWNARSLNYYPEVLLRAVNSQEFDLDNLHETYDAAKITLYLNEGFNDAGSYLRLMDALSSDACVIAQKGGKYDDMLSSIGVPMFENVSEARALCDDLLKNPDKLKKFVETTHANICERFNEKSVLSSISHAFGIINTNSACGNLDIINELALDYTNEPMEISANKCSVKLNPVKKEGKFKKLVKAVLLRFGYDLDNKFNKKCYMLGPIILYENMKIDGSRNHIYILSLPILTLKKKNNRIYVRPLMLEKFVKLFLKPLRKLNKALKNRRKNSKSQKEIRKLLAVKGQTYTDLNRKLARGEKIRICLFVSRISCWTFGNLYKILLSSGKFEPIVVVKPFMHQGHDAMVEYMNTTYNALKAQGYNVIKTYDEATDTFMDLRKELNPDILFYTKYWLPQFQENFYINKFRDKLTFYTSYCYDVAYHPEVMNFELNNAVDRYFMPTEIHHKMAQDFMDNHGENVHVVGAPKLDVFFDKTYKPIDKWKAVNDGKTRKRIIWAPHHSDNFPQNLYQFNAFYELADYMFELAKKYENEIQIAFKPHPMLKPYLYYKWGKQSTDSYYNKWAQLKNGQLETGEFEDLFLTSDAMILDSISFIAEYTAVNKPALFTIGSTSRVNLNDFGNINFNVLYHTKNDMKKDIEEFVQEVVIKGRDYKKSGRQAFVSQYLMPPNGKSSAENIYDNIIDEIKNGAKGKRYDR